MAMATQLPRRRTPLSWLRRQRQASGPAVDAPNDGEVIEGLLVRFETVGARRRFIPLPMRPRGAVFRAPGPVTAPGVTSPPFEHPVSAHAVPDTVSCGHGYLEVLGFVDGGVVLNEVRTHGDVIEMTLIDDEAVYARAEAALLRLS